jgi:Ulp1 family protease
MEDEIYLSYKTVCLRSSDVACFQNFRQLNDLCISFFYERLSEQFKSFEKEFVLVDPSAVSTIVFDNDIQDLIDCYGELLKGKRYIFLPVNDNTNKYVAGGGTHWALLLFDTKERCFYYLDSMLSYINNTDIISQKIIKIIDYYTGQETPEPNIIQPLERKYQDNTYDCGMYVLLFTKVILTYLFENDLYNQPDFSNETFTKLFKKHKVDSYSVKKVRENILEEIEFLRK